MVERIVARCHVGQSDRSVINYVVSRLKDGRKTFFGLSRARRKALLRRIIRAHRENQNLYRKVMSGRI